MNDTWQQLVNFLIKRQPLLLIPEIKIFSNLFFKTSKYNLIVILYD